MTAPELRAADADRDHVVEQLSTHAAAGRLDADELEERTAAALAAKTMSELEALTADMPAQAPGPERRARRRLPAGLRTYLAVMALLVAIWAIAGGGYFWPAWPALGWGFALLSPGGCGSSRRGGRRVGSRRHALPPLRT